MTTGEFVCLQLNKAFPKKTFGGRMSALNYSETEYSWAKAAAPALFKHIDLKDKVVLDAGCGLGGRSAFYAESGAQSVTGVDLDMNHLQHSREFAAHKKLQNISFKHASLAELPFDDDTFDVVLLNDVVEHIARPLLVNALKECKRVLKRGGKLFIEFPPWTSHDAGHLYDFVRIPWCHLLFSEKTLVNVMNRMEQAPRFGRLSHVEHFEELNKITIDEFKAMIGDIGFTIVTLDRRMIKDVAALEHVPLVNKYLTTRVIAVLSK